MEINAAHSALIPWINHYGHVTCSPFLQTSFPGQHVLFGNLNLQNEQQTSILNVIKLPGGVVKPKAIRISDIRRVPTFSDYNLQLGLDVKELRGNNDDSEYMFGCSPRAIRSLASGPCPFGFPYPFPHPLTFNGSLSTYDTKNIFREMFQNQMQLLQYQKPSDCTRLREASIGTRESVEDAPDLFKSSNPGFYDQSFNIYQQERGGLKSSTQKNPAAPLKGNQKVCVESRGQESTKSHLSIQKRRQKSLKHSKKHFMTPLTKNIKSVTKKLSMTIESKPQSSDELQKLALLSEALPRSSCSLITDTPLERTSGSPSSREKYVTTNGLRREKADASSQKLAVIRGKLPENNETTTVTEGASLYSVQSGFSEDRKTFKCPQCRYLTDRKNNLKRHIVTMHQESSKTLECCGIGFQSKAALRDHNLIFHRGGYRCQICSRNFCRKALLRRHLTVHSGQKDFFCSLCGYATSHKSNLERHQKIHTRREATASTVRKCVTLKLSLGTSSVPDTVINSWRSYSRHGDAQVSSTSS